jgi:two-component system phosphate regulon sensor histidine kinase PhoR
MTDVAEKIAKGDFSKRIFSIRNNELGLLAKAINKMATSLERQFSVIETEKRQLMTILDGMVEGVLVTDEKGEILLVNPSLRSMLGLEGICTGKTILECLRNQSVHQPIERVLQSRRPEEYEIGAWIGSEERFLIVHTAPLAAANKNTGCVSVFYDVTNIRKLENTRKEFVANVSHELKTPLTNILGYAETLRRGALEDMDSAKRFVEKIENNAAQLRSLVEDILKISQIESGRLEMNPEPLRLLEETDRLIQSDFEERILIKKLVFEKNISPEVTIDADSSAFKRVLGNLIDNAIKYTPEGGKIVVSVKEDDDFCRIIVDDSGVGIAEQDLPHLFERFYRADKARSRQMGGTGLGLSIVKHFVQAHGGEVGVESRSGKGARFFFTLPLKR